MPSVSPDAVIAARAARQEGNVTFLQCREAGLSSEEIKTRKRRGLLIPRHRGVYAVGHVPDAWFSSAFAAWLAYGKASALSHLKCAAALRVVPPPEDDLLHLTRPTRGREHEGTKLHTANLAGDVWHRRGLVVTSLARLMLDLAATEPPALVERAYNQAQVLKLITPSQLNDRIDDWTGRRGVLLLKALLEHHGVSRSELEDAFRRLVAEAALPAYERNVWIDGVFADAVWRDQRVVVELDSRTFHSDDATFESDRRKANRLAYAGGRSCASPTAA